MKVSRFRVRVKVECNYINRGVHLHHVPRVRVTVRVRVRVRVRVIV